MRIEGEIDVCVADRLQELLLRITRAMHLIAASAMVRKIITLTGAEVAFPVRDQSGNSSSGDAEAAARRDSN